MKYLLHFFLFLSFTYVSININAQVTRLSNNTNLEIAIPLGTIAVLISDKDSLWRTDGTVAGTLKYATNVAVDSPYAFTIFAGKIYFKGADANGEELWETNGTAAGTQLVKDINLAGNGSPENFMEYNNALYFFADNGTTGKELWKSDGTAGGTALLKDINPGAGSSVPTFTSYFIHNGQLFFNADDGTTGAELWKTDGTPGGTVLVKDINPGPAPSNAVGFTIFGSIVLFNADDGTNGAELWKTDGTTTGTQLVKDIATGFFGSSPTGFTLFNNKIYFDALDFTNGFEGWVTDGTTANTTLLKDINPGFESGFPFFINALFLNNKMYFPASTTAEGTELWWSDGTTANTLLFKDINTGAEGSEPFFFLNFFNVTDINSFHSNLFNGIMFLQAKTAGAGTELWKTDGTDAGTVIVKDINPGADSSLGDSFTYFYTSNHLYFSATDGTTGYELWKSDATAANTTRVFDINPGTASSDPSFLTYFNGIVLFNAHDGDNGTGLRDLFRLDGTFTPMPLNLLTFRSTVFGKTVQLNWSTVSEINTSHFAIERSTDGIRFETIGKVNAAGNSSEQKEYLYHDVNATNANSNKIFYRLKMFDRDEKFTYSKVLAVKILRDEKLVAYPNPVKGELTIVVNSNSSQAMELRIFDESGKQVYNRKVNTVAGNNSYAVNVASFVNGAYYINIVTNEGIETTKFIKK